MRAFVHALVLTSFGSTVVAQTLTLTFPNGPTVVQVFTTDANGHFTKETIATLSGSTPPTSSPFPATPPSLTSASTTNDAGSAPNPTGPSTFPQAKGVAAGVVAGISVAAVILIALALALLFLRRRKRRAQRGRVKAEIDPVVGSPVVDGSFMPDPFVTDMQARGMGYDTSRQATRRLEARFISEDQRGPERSQADYTDARVLAAPRIAVTGESRTTGPPITHSSSGQHGTYSLTSRSSSNEPARDVKLSEVLSTTPSSSPRAPSEMPSSTSSDSTSTFQPRPDKKQNRMAPDSGVALVHLQRQVEMLRRENEELRSTGEPPPAYEGDGRL
ncbi:hypothetical protein LshimejAT787_1402120 [Lyophyllum shimeji]|uniref:Uncharacterized protein n=1 Tax=Lyophyllum shimeji TaxID=47721 RepID=A0A9P3PXA1_LYOSH|nr:hypothetical protein LshimejAT787_1402120 [Lyophyllum shimeji]